MMVTRSCYCGTLLDHVVALADVQVKALPPPTNYTSTHSISSHTSPDTSVDPGTYDYTTLGLSVTSSLEFCNQEYRSILQS